MNTDAHRYDDDRLADLNEITFRVNGCAMAVLNEIGHGFHEKVYENALALEFDNRGVNFARQKQFEVSYRNKSIGVFIPDFVIEDRIILELKTIDRIGVNEKSQVLNYLRASGLPLGIILNFKNPKLEWQRVIL